MKDCVAKGRHNPFGNAGKQACCHGHQYSAGNTIINAQGYRECRTCRRNRIRKPYKRCA
jgi:uncharacterized Zn-binding protein involved in type VI secretion